MYVWTARIPPISPCYSDVLPRHDGGVWGTWYISITEYMVIFLLAIPVAARVGAVGVACIDPWMINSDLDVLIPFPTDVFFEVDDIGLLEIVRGNSLDRVSSCIICVPSFNFDWVWIEPAQRWYPYQSSLG